MLYPMTCCLDSDIDLDRNMFDTLLEIKYGRLTADSIHS